MITQAQLKELLHYDPETGLFTHLRKKAGVSFGSVAGCTRSDGYIVITINGETRQAHRMAFLWMLGYIPYEVDHDNGNPSDNRWANLNAASSLSNRRNRCLSKNNKSGFHGVSYSTRNAKWVAEIFIDRVRVYLGAYEDLAFAVLARKWAEQISGYHPNHGRAA